MCFKKYLSLLSMFFHGDVRMSLTHLLGPPWLWLRKLYGDFHNNRMPQAHLSTLRVGYDRPFMTALETSL